MGLTGYCLLLCTLSLGWAVCQAIVAYKTHPSVAPVYEFVGRRVLLLVGKTCKLLVVMAHRCFGQPVVIGIVLDLALMPLMGGNAYMRLAFFRCVPCRCLCCVRLISNVRVFVASSRCASCWCTGCWACLSSSTPHPSSCRYTLIN